VFVATQVGAALSADRRRPARSPQTYRDRARCRKRFPLASKVVKYAQHARTSVLVVDRLALVTGTTSGIGQAVADALLHRGWHVVGAARRPSTIGHDAYEHLQIDLGDARALTGIEERLTTLLMSYEPGTVDTPMQAHARAQGEDVLPSRDLFVRFAAEGRLVSPAAPAREIADFLESDGGDRFAERRFGV